MKRMIGLLMMMCSSIAWAHNDTTQSVGFVAGSTHGIGLTYARQNNESGIGWQVSGFPVWSEDERHLFGGLAIFKTLHQGRKGRGFISFGVATDYHRSVIERWDDSSSEPDDSSSEPIGEEVDESANVLFGPGIGLERKFAENFTISLEIPAAVSISSDEKFSILPIPNFALSYRW